MTREETIVRGFLPITKIPSSGLPDHAIVCGDPARAARIAKRLKDGREIGNNREYVTLQGSWDGMEIVVSSHGVGGSGAMCCFEELAMAGVTTFVRVGTCGALADEIEDGHLVLATAAIRDDGVTQYMVPDGFPAFSSPEVVFALERAARELGHPWHSGLVWTKSVFFSYPGGMPMPWERYIGVGAIAVEMELSALLVVASMRGLRAGGILTSDGNPLKRRVEDEYDPHRAVVADGVDASVEVALRALRLLAQGSA